MSRTGKTSASKPPSSRPARVGHAKRDDGKAEASIAAVQVTSGPGDVSPPPEASPRRAVLELIREVQSGVLDPRNIGHEERRACVAYLTAEGYTVPEIAQVLRTCDRTVHRDREKIRSENALRPSAGLVSQLVGQLSTEAMTAVQRLRRIGRDKEAPHSARVDAERGAWLVYREFVQSLQRLGYLPTAVPSVSAHVTHQLSPFLGHSPAGGALSPGLPLIEEMREELSRLEDLQRSIELTDSGQGDDVPAASSRPTTTHGGAPRGVGASVMQARRAILLLEAGHHIESARHEMESQSDGNGAPVDGPAGRSS